MSPAQARVILGVIAKVTGFIPHPVTQIISKGINAGIAAWSLYDVGQEYYTVLQNKQAETKGDSRPTVTKGKGGSSGSYMPDPDDGDSGKKTRKSDTQKNRDDFIRSKIESGELSKLRGIRSGKPTWSDKKCTRFYQKSQEGWEIEVYDKSGKHIGVIKPSDGVLRTEMAVPGRSINVK